MFSVACLVTSSLAAGLLLPPDRPTPGLLRLVPFFLSSAISSLIAAITLARASGDALSSSSLETPTLLKYAVISS